MLIPLLVMLMFPERKALLLSGSSHEPTPWVIVEYSSLQFSMAWIVPSLWSPALPSAFHTFPPCAHSHQCVQAFASPTACPRENPVGCPLARSALASLRKLGMSLGNASNPASRTQETR